MKIIYIYIYILFKPTNIYYSLLKNNKKIWKFTLSIFEFLGYSSPVLLCFLHTNQFPTIYVKEN